MRPPPSHEWPEGARAVLHVDMDAFYASVEVREDPSLRGKPVIVGGPRDARGVVSAASYEARRYGVRSAMPLRRAARLCPQGVFLPVRMDLYAEASQQVFAILDRFTPLVEPLSVDEAFLDLTGSERLHGSPVRAAGAIRAAIHRECRLTASVGVAPNKFVAKIASDLEKPDGLVVVPPGGVEAFLAPLPVERMWGVGPRGAELLHARGIRTFGDLARAGAAALRPAFGTSADALAELARGRDARPVVTSRAPRSLGRETTFPEDVRDERILHATLVALSDAVASRLRRHGLRARTVALKVRYAPFRTVTRRKTLDPGACSTAAVLEAVLDLFRPEGDPVRLLGVSVSGFSGQASLFDARDLRRQEAVDRAVDAARRRFGASSVRRASALDSFLHADQGPSA